MVGAALALIANFAVQAFVQLRTHRRERAMHRAQIAASAFGDFFAVVSRLRTIKGAHENKSPDMPGLVWEVEFKVALDDLHAARGRLAAVAGPKIVTKLAELERSIGFTASAPEGQRVLTEVLVLLREDLGVDSGAQFSDLQTLLFSP